MRYETRNHWFIWNNQKIDLTNKEHIFITHLRYGETVTFDELSMALYGIKADKGIKSLLRHAKMTVSKKVPIKIASIYNQGYMLKTEILFCAQYLKMYAY